MKRILIVEDEIDIIELVQYNLKREGFSVDSAQDGESALRKIRSNGYSLIILDLMLPVISGLELCRMLKRDNRTSSIPIIMLTAKDEEADKIVGLEMGADDYVTKPFSPRELAARVKAVLRRTEEEYKATKEMKIRDLYINFDTYKVYIKDKPVKLSVTEFRLLKFLIEQKGKISTRDQLLDAVWKGDVFVTPRTVDVHINRLRNQIEEDPKNPRYIKTMRGIGYYFSGDGD
jgi:phosphate regulon transcriptional regulator PhoB